MYVKECEKNAWKLYIAETVRCISGSSAKFAGGPYITVKWDDIINPKPVETRTPEQVIDQIMKRLASF